MFVNLEYMFIRTRDEVREREGVFSKHYMNHVLALPEVYYCTEVGDFVENQDLVVPTGFKLFNPGKKFRDTCLVGFPSCYYKRKSPASEEEKTVALNSSYRKIGPVLKKIKLARTEEDFLKIRRETNSILRERNKKFAVSELYDLIGNSFPLNGGNFDDIPEGKIYDVIILYAPNDCSGFLLSYHTHSDWPALEDGETASSLIEVLQAQLSY